MAAKKPAFNCNRSFDGHLEFYMILKDYFELL